MIRKLVLTAAAIATLGTASLTVTATPASAHHWGGYHGGYHHFHGYRGFGFYAGGYDTCLRRVWVVNRAGYSVPRTINVCD